MDRPRRPSRQDSGPHGGFVQQVFEFFSRSIWELELARLPPARGGLVKLARIAYLATRGFVQDRCLVRAAALTYVTLLSIVPMLAVSFAAAKGLGFYKELIQQTVEPFLDRTFGDGHPRPVASVEVGGDVGDGAGAEEATPAEAEATVREDMRDLRGTIDEVLSFVEGTDFNKIGWPALAIFLYTIIKMLGTIEVTFNEIWGVTRSRSWIRKISDYLSMVLITPVLLFLGAGVTAATRESALVNGLGLGPVVQFAAGLSSWFAVLAGFTFLYLAMPNTKVRFSSGLLGGVVTSLLWLGVVVLHVKFQVGIARANAVYSSFAALPIFLVFVNLCWIVVLVGAELAFAHQSEPTYREVESPYPDDHALREVVALRAVARVARSFLVGDPPPTPGELALALGVPVRPVQEVLATLARVGVLAETDKSDDVAYLPARPLDVLRVLDVLDGLRGQAAPEDAPPKATVDGVLDRALAGFEEELAASRHNLTLRELADLAQQAETERLEAQRELGLRGQGSTTSAAT